MTTASIVRSNEWQSWLGSPAGQYLLRWEQAQMNAVVGDLFGYHAVELALPGMDCLVNSRVKTRISVVLAGEQWVAQPRNAGVVVEDFEDLPFLSSSLDLVVLPHALEFVADPYQTLREVERVLRPEGKVVITGINPFSFWGARQLAKPLLGNYLPTQGEFVSLPRLRDWLRLLSMEVDQGIHGGFALPVRSEVWFERMAWLENLGHQCWPICGAFYLVTATKRVRGMRLFGPAWKRARVRGARAAVATPSSSVKKVRDGSN